MILIQL